MNITNTTSAELVKVFYKQQRQLDGQKELWRMQVQMNKELSDGYRQSIMMNSVFSFVICFLLAIILLRRK